MAENETSAAEESVESPASEAPVSQSEEATLDLSDLLEDDLGEDDSGVETPAPEVPETTADVKPEAEVPDASGEPEAEPQVEAKVEPEPPAPAEQQVEQEQPEQNFEEIRAREIERLEQHYQLSEDDAKTMALEPEKVLPKMAARLYTDVFEAAVQTISRSLPQMMESVTQQRQARDSARDAFFSEFPALKGHENQVEAALVQYKQFYPAATRDQAIAQVGLQISLANKLPLPQKYMAQFGVPQEPEPPAPRGPIAPAAAGSSSGPPPKPSDNYFERLAEEDLED